MSLAEKRKEALKKLEGLVELYARKYAYWMRGRGNHYEDLKQEGMCGALKALDRFDETRGTKLSTYAFAYICSAMQAYAENFCSDTRVSHNAYVYRSQLSRSDRNKVIEQEIWPRLAALEALRYMDDIGNIPEEIMDLDRKLDLSIVYQAVMLLPLKQQRVILGYHFEHKTLEDVGKEMGWTREYVRQLQEKGIAKLKYLLFSKNKKLIST